MNYPAVTNSAPVKLLQPYDDRVVGVDRDFAATGSFSLYALERMLRDCTLQPQWRLRAKLCAAYYDGKQLSELQRYALSEEQLEERAINLIRPIVNSVLGQETRSRTDVRVETDDDEFADTCEAINYRLKEAERETCAHQAVSDAYGSMVKKGLGWLHVCRNADPLAYPYRFEAVDLDEIWWDWRGQKGSRLDDRCRWLCRMRMIDLDELIAAMPEHRTVLEQTAAGWDDPRFDLANLLGQPEDIELQEQFDAATRFSSLFRRYDWIDSARKMIKVIEVWYRVPAMAIVMVFPGSTRRMLFDPQNPRHRELVSRQLVQLVKGPTSQVRRALYAGPHRLMDSATTRKAFPYIPMFAYRDDDDKSPYGLIDGMIAPQDDYNDRHHRIQWMLKARQLFIDNDALDTEHNTIDEVAEQVMRPDLAVVLDANRKNKDGVVIANTLQMQKEQFELLAMSEMNIQKTAGRYGSNLGEAKVQSGVANQLLIEQGEQSMAEMNDNYTHARRAAFDQLVQLIVDDHKKPDLPVAIGQGKARRVIVLNTWQPKPLYQPNGEPAMQPVVDPQTGQPMAGPDGQPVMQPVMGPAMPTNMVEDAEIRTGLAEVPNTPAYRQQTQMQLKDILTALGNNPQATALLAPAYIESTTLSDRQETADDLRRMAGLPPKGDRKARQAAEQAQMAAAAKQAQLAEATQIAEAKDKEAGAMQKMAQARKVNAEAEALERRLRAGGIEAEVAATQMANGRQLIDAGGEEDEIDAAIKDAAASVA